MRSVSQSWQQKKRHPTNKIEKLHARYSPLEKRVNAKRRQFSLTVFCVSSTTAAVIGELKQFTDSSSVVTELFISIVRFKITFCTRQVLIVCLHCIRFFVRSASPDWFPAVNFRLMSQKIVLEAEALATSSIATQMCRLGDDVLICVFASRTWYLTRHLATNTTTSTSSSSDNTMHRLLTHITIDAEMSLSI